MGGWVRPIRVAVLFIHGHRCCSWTSSVSSASVFPAVQIHISISALHCFSDIWILDSCSDCHRLDLNFVTLLYMQTRQPLVFRPVVAYRPLQALTPTSSFILAGGGQAVLIQHSILSFLYDSEGPNPDIQAFGVCAPALKLVTQSWTKVDTPSVSSRAQQHGFWD